VSRRHALIDELRLLDDGSLNGVFLNGNRTQSGRLTHGDEIRVGRHRLLYGVFDPLARPAGIVHSARAIAVRDAVPA
jgi:pSer/pThr/pTyr-binding forkhead associated (FHA) protein